MRVQLETHIFSNYLTSRAGLYYLSGFIEDRLLNLSQIDVIRTIKIDDISTYTKGTTCSV
jgi:hypothetical protein